MVIFTVVDAFFVSGGGGVVLFLSLAVLKAKRRQKDPCPLENREDFKI